MAAAFDLGGSIALVTGASSGLGRHFALVLASAGAAVALAARRTDMLAEAVAEIAKAGGKAVAVALDVTQPASVAAALSETERRIGPLDILVNNAGTVTSKPLLEHSEEDWDRVVDTNLKGAWLVAQEAARRWIGAGRAGRVVNIASILGIRAQAGIPGYVASKAGLIHLTHALALELGPKGITVNALAPGYIETDLNRDYLRSDAGKALARRIPLRRIGAMEDLDGALLLLASPAGAYINGVVIPIDGGHLVSAL
ncbi:MAG TPA: glucose 1-dehydrogenase [Stellaceae bacterium]|nr:glucose 1-dehydrogenase [Stellaceae bacterium]